MIEQDEACYEWTYTLYPREHQTILSLDDAQALIRHVWFFYRPDTIAPLVRDSINPEFATGARYAIHLPHWARNKSLILHEAAHSLGFDDSGNVLDEGFERHGPLYMRTVMDLYTMFLGTSRTEMLDLAARLNLQV